ncbi:replication protein [Virgibacillus halodenitrificans]|uniref:replication protein n=1 Tax=Virgibacillus halodenitrificans TaxID=1482 RepID=UPI000EF4F85B|nr:replication protein [Virgibacillus halodenitrificans]
MASPQTEKGHVRIANELWNEVLRRDFSKRQQNLILFIWRLSYGTGQKDCFIERFNLLELAGMYKQDVKKELKFLRECAVLNWDEDSMIFSINKNYHLWQITPNKNWDSDKFNSLIHQNLSRKKVSKTLTDDSVPENKKVSKILTFKSELVSKTLTMQLVKYLPTQGGNAVVTVNPASLKTLLYTLKIKDIKDNNNNSNPTREEVSEIRTTNPFKYYEQNFEPVIPPAIVDKINSWLDDFSEEMVLLAMERCLEQEEYKRKWGYINRILVNWYKNKIMTPEQVAEADEKFYSKKNSYAKSQPQSAEIIPEWFKNRNVKSDDQPKEGHKENEQAELEALIKQYAGGQ